MGDRKGNGRPVTVGVWGGDYFSAMGQPSRWDSGYSAGGG